MRADWTNYGEVFTREWVVDSILDLVGYQPGKDLGKEVLVEPSVGSGAFLVRAVERLLGSAEKRGHPIQSLGGAIRGFDLMAGNVANSRRRVVQLLTARNIDQDVAKALANEWLSLSDFLLLEELPVADYVVGNPPYIRLEDIPADVTSAYRERWQTMRGRADIYIGFYERGLSILAENGKLGFICADRWMRNQYGANLRKFVTDRFAVDHVWVMHDVDAFEAQVDAYPAITVFSNKSQSTTVVAATTKEFSRRSATHLREWSLSGNGVEESGHGFVAHRMSKWFTGEDLWPAGSPSLVALVEYLKENFFPLLETVKVGIGVASGADKTYVVRDAPVERDRLLPLSMVSDLRSSGEFEWGGNYLVNPWTRDGKLVRLTDYPKLRKYFENSANLRGRHTAKKNPQQWFRTIDKVNDDLVNKPKLLIQDMRSTINPVLEPGGFYPHHNLYYLTSDIWDLEVLGGILISRIGQGFIEAYGVRMRGGTLRFQAQYLKKICLPDPGKITENTKELLKVAFRSRDVEAATISASAAYGIDPIAFGLISREGVTYVGRR